MSNELIINATPQETRVAFVENGQLCDFYLERRRTRGQVGNIYVGRVQRVLPGMQAAFVEIGLEKSAFLYGGDVADEHTPQEFDSDDDSDDGGSSGGKSGARRKKSQVPIEKRLKEGQEVLVQVSKDPIGTKGARVTGHVSLPGRHLVFMPTVDHLGISRQISSDKERKRLRNVANEMRPKGGGFIVRTASEGVPSEYLKQDMALLISMWNEILVRRDKSSAPALIHVDLDLMLRATRDLATADLDRLIVDDRAEYERILNFVDKVMPEFAGNVELYVGDEPVLDAYGIEKELTSTLSKRVQLPSGGYLIIEKTEALTAIDVNTGRFTGRSRLEDTIFQTNIEACEEIAYQLRLRNIGGLVILDLIDMEQMSNRKKVQRALDKALATDRGRVKVSRISEFGLVEMTRKRTRESLIQVLGEECQHCEGQGWVLSSETVSYQILRQLRRELARHEAFDVVVRANPSVLQQLRQRERETLRALELQFNKKVHLKQDTKKRIPDFTILGEKNPGQSQRAS